MHLESGDVIGGKYRVERPLGQGGMGAVYVALDERLQRRVALKVLSASLEGREEAEARFRREAIVASRVRHPNVIEIYDADVDGGTPWIAMELLEGESVEALLGRRTRLAPGEAAWLGREVLSALEEIHAEGIVHRDLKPANLFLERRRRGGPRLKVLDFGIARGTTSTVTSITQQGSTLGTPWYMPPEQLLAQDLDGRVDVFALGVILFECLAGRRPFVAERYEQVVAQILAIEAPPLASLRPDVPPALASAVARALARSRDARFASASAMLDALGASGVAPVVVGEHGALAATAPLGTARAAREPRVRSGPAVDATASLDAPAAAPRERKAAAQAAPFAKTTPIDAQTPAESESRARKPAAAAALDAQGPRARHAATSPLEAQAVAEWDAAARHAGTDAPNSRLPRVALGAGVLVLLAGGVGLAAWASDEPVEETIPESNVDSNDEPQSVTALTITAFRDGLIRIDGVDRGRVGVDRASVFEVDGSRDHVVALLGTEPPLHSIVFAERRVLGSTRTLTFSDPCDEGDVFVPLEGSPGLCVQRREVTMGEHRRCVDAGRCEPIRGSSSFCNVGRALHPVNCINLAEAAAYCAFAGGRLPTASEWTFAARASTTRRFPWGSARPDATRVHWSAEGGRASAGGTAVASGREAGASPFGVLDMAGNVAEWTNDREGEEAIVLGGSWADVEHDEISIDRRLRAPATVQSPGLGIRCVRAPTPAS